MPVDSTNYGRELRNIFAEIKSLRAEVANMQSALLGVQEQYGYAVVELLNRSQQFDKEISEIKFQLQNSDEISQQKFEDLKIQSGKISDLMNENLKSVQERFSQLEKLLADNLDKINSRYTFSSQQNEISNKNLSALEELLRLIAANQMLDEVEKNLPEQNKLPKVSASKQSKDISPQRNFADNLASNFKNSVEPTTPDGMYERGMDYFGGRNGYSKNKTHAFKYFMEAAKCGHVKAMQTISDCYSYGWGVVQDEYQARLWYQKYLQVM